MLIHLLLIDILLEYKFGSHTSNLILNILKEKLTFFLIILAGMELEQLRTKVQILQIKVSYLETQIQNIQDSLQGKNIALEAEVTRTKPSIPS